jgi:hypothetical protein
MAGILTKQPTTPEFIVMLDNINAVEPTPAMRLEIAMRNYWRSLRHRVKKRLV